MSHRKMQKKNDRKTNNHILLVLPGVQATKHQSEGLDDRKQTQAVGDHERRVETELLEWLQLFTEGLTRGFSSSTKPNQHRRRRKVFDNFLRSEEYPRSTCAGNSLVPKNACE